MNYFYKLVKKKRKELNVLLLIHIIVEILLIYFKDFWDFSETIALLEQRITLVLRFPFRLEFGKVKIVVINGEHFNKVVIQV